jgi:uncharacterized protein YbaR (Trm112 family)
MLLDVRPILHEPGKHLDFRFELDLSDVELAGRHPISRPVAVVGTVRNAAGVLELELTARSTLDAVCDRCGKAFDQEKEIPFRCLLAEELQNEDNDEIVLRRTARRTWRIWPGRPSSSEWTRKLCVLKIARDFAPGAAQISIWAPAPVKRRPIPAGGPGQAFGEQIRILRTVTPGL